MGLWGVNLVRSKGAGCWGGCWGRQGRRDPHMGRAMLPPAGAQERDSPAVQPGSLGLVEPALESCSQMICFLFPEQHPT